MRDLEGVTVVVTGVIAGYSRQTAEQKLRNAGAVVHSSVGRTTKLLVTGAKVGKRKLEAAERHGAEVVPWEALWRGAAPAEAWEEVQPSSYPSSDDAVMSHVPRKQYGPMLAKAGELPTGDGWLHEIKWDGYRCLAFVDGGRVAMISRSAKSNYVEAFPHVAQVLAKWPNVVLDGELVDLSQQGPAMSGARKNGASLLVFDVLELDGEDKRSLPLIERRFLLEHAMAHTFEELGDGVVMLSPVFEDGVALLAEVAERRLEGVMSKPKSSRYVDGHRGWVKVKLRNQQEFVVLGWTKGKGALEGVVGGLALGYRDGENWVYVGRAGTGPKEHERVMLLERLEGLDKGRPPNVLTGNAANAEIQRIQWVKPEMVVNVAFQRWSPDGRLVIPSLKGIREDKDAMDVGREP